MTTYKVETGGQAIWKYQVKRKNSSVKIPQDLYHYFCYIMNKNMEVGKECESKYLKNYPFNICSTSYEAADYKIIY